jgi:hypothetical protein
MTLIPVVVKHNRIHSTMKYWGGVLNPNAHYYVQKIESKTNPLTKLQEIVHARTHH